MPRVTFVKKARKDNPVCKAGESYFWWKFRYGGKRYSLTRPRASQLTQSAYLGTLHGISENIEDYTVSEPSDMEALTEEVREQAQELSDETQESLDNMPDQLQYSPTGELLQERIDALYEVDSAADMVEEFEFEEEEFDEQKPEREDCESDTDFNDELFLWEEAKTDHQVGESERYTEEFQSWVDESKSTLSEAVESALV